MKKPAIFIYITFDMFSELMKNIIKFVPASAVSKLYLIIQEIFFSIHKTKSKEYFIDIKSTASHLDMAEKTLRKYLHLLNDEGFIKLSVIRECNDGIFVNRSFISLNGTKLATILKFDTQLRYNSKRYIYYTLQQFHAVNRRLMGLKVRSLSTTRLVLDYMKLQYQTQRKPSIEFDYNNCIKMTGLALDTIKRTVKELFTHSIVDKYEHRDNQDRRKLVIRFSDEFMELLELDGFDSYISDDFYCAMDKAIAEGDYTEYVNAIDNMNMTTANILYLYKTIAKVVNKLSQPIQQHEVHIINAFVNKHNIKPNQYNYGTIIKYLKSGKHNWKSEYQMKDMVEYLKKNFKTTTQSNFKATLATVDEFRIETAKEIRETFKVVHTPKPEPKKPWYKDSTVIVNDDVDVSEEDCGLYGHE